MPLECPDIFAADAHILMDRVAGAEDFKESLFLPVFGVNHCPYTGRSVLLLNGQNLSAYRHLYGLSVNHFQGEFVNSFHDFLLDVADLSMTRTVGQP